MGVHGNRGRQDGDDDKGVKSGVDSRVRTWTGSLAGVQSIAVRVSATRKGLLGRWLVSRSLNVADFPSECCVVFISFDGESVAQAMLIVLGHGSSGVTSVSSNSVHSTSGRVRCSVRASMGESRRQVQLCRCMTRKRTSRWIPVRSCGQWGRTPARSRLAPTGTPSCLKSGAVAL